MIIKCTRLPVKEQVLFKEFLLSNLFYVERFKSELWHATVHGTGIVSSGADKEHAITELVYLLSKNRFYVNNQLIEAPQFFLDLDDKRKSDFNVKDITYKGVNFDEFIEHENLNVCVDEDDIFGYSAYIHGLFIDSKSVTPEGALYLLAEKLSGKSMLNGDQGNRLIKFPEFKPFLDQQNVKLEWSEDETNT